MRHWLRGARVTPVEGNSGEPDGLSGIRASDLDLRRSGDEVDPADLACAERMLNSGVAFGERNICLVACCPLKRVVRRLVNCGSPACTPFTSGAGRQAPLLPVPRRLVGRG